MPNMLIWKLLYGASVVILIATFVVLAIMWVRSVRQQAKRDEQHASSLES